MDISLCIEPLGTNPCCTNTLSFNYDELANTDDYSCVNILYGCIDSNSMNYNYLANTDDGSCVNILEGCTDFSAINYNISANVDDGSCEYSVGGCTNELYIEFDEEAQFSDGSCETLIVTGCINSIFVEFDPLVKEKINPTDSQRIQRAYEVKLKTKKSLFHWFKKTKSDFLDYDLKKIFINISRADLLQNISKRTDLMFANNCLVEVKRFNAMSVSKNLSANKLIGVREVNQYLDDNVTLEECKELINIKTRQYAKRQNTWARGHMKNWNMLYYKNFSILLKKTLKLVS